MLEVTPTHIAIASMMEVTLTQEVCGVVKRHRHYYTQPAMTTTTIISATTSLIFVIAKLRHSSKNLIKLSLASLQEMHRSR